MRRPGLLLALVLVLTTGHGWAARQPVSVVTAYHIVNTVTELSPPESNVDIARALRKQPDIGGTVYIFLHNQSDKLVTVNSISWHGIDVKTRLEAPNYDVMWWKSSPKAIPAGAECELAVCLRESLKGNTVFAVDLGESGKVVCEVKARYSGPRLATVAFSPDLKSAYLYVETAGGAPGEVYIDGKPVGAAAKVLGNKTANGLAVIHVVPAAGFRQGDRHLFRIVCGKQSCAGSVRAFGDLSRFGTYGVSDAKTYSAAGLSSYISFSPLDEKTLDQFGSVGMKAAMTIGMKNPDPYMVGNRSIYAYLAMDEPDCHDFSKEDRPMHKRLGSYGQELVDWHAGVEQADPSIPTLTTVDLTFAPQNYFAYAKVADMVNPDCYTLYAGWPITAFRDKMSIMKRASAPQPFVATYQAYFQEHATGLGSRYVGAPEIEEKGSEELIDRTKPFGYGRAPTPEEARIPMLYAVGSGARGLFGYIAATEAFSTFLFHSTLSLPEVWEITARTSRELRVVSPLIQISHPTIWCKSDESSLWVRTLVCGEKAALVVAVNEACKSEKECFVPSPVESAEFHFTDMPWLKASHVYRLGDGKLDPVGAVRANSGLTWKASNVSDGEIYLVCADESLAANLIRTYFATAPQATPDGMKVLPEGHLKGRRKTPIQQQDGR